MNRHTLAKSMYKLLLVLGMFFAGQEQLPAGDSQKPSLPPSSTPMASGLIVFNSNRSGNHEICVMNPDGSAVKELIHDGRYDSWWPRVSPDRRHILFYRNAKSKRKEDYSQTALWVMAADGSGITELRPVGMDGWGSQGHAEWSPDGKQLVMFGGPRRHNPQISITSNAGGEPRQITNRSGTNLDPSWSPDGKQIVFVGCPAAICFSGDYEIYTVAVSGDQPAVRRTFDNLRDHDPYFSPDGKHVAWLTQTAGMFASPPAGSWSIRIAQADSAGLGQGGFVPLDHQRQEHQQLSGGEDRCRALRH